MLFIITCWLKLHPLEEKLTFTVAISTSNPIIKMNNSQKINSIIDIFSTACDDVNNIYGNIKSEIEKI